jgi:hypothetical protein
VIKMLLCWTTPNSLSDLKTIQAGLEGQLEVLARWLVFWTGLVVLGLMMEYGPEFTKWKPRNLKKPRSFMWVKIWVIMGGVLVVGGVAGELNVESRSSRVETTLRDTSGQIETLLTTEAGDAMHNAELASAASSRAENSAKEAGVAAGKAQDKAGAVAKRANELNRELQASKKQLDAVDAKRAELEKSLLNLAVCTAPRVLQEWTIGDRKSLKSSIDPLKPFAGYQAIIEFVPNDAEARRAALSIAAALAQAGWKFFKEPTAVGTNVRIFDGVEVQPFAGLSDGSMWGAQMRSGDVADAIVDFLHSYNWQARRGWLTDEKGALIHDLNVVPADGLRIRVGLYPAVPFVAPPGAKDLVVALAQIEQEREQNRKQIEQEQLKMNEKYLKTATPQEVIAFKARREQREKEDKLRMERDTGPCQPLNPLVPR